MCCVLFSSTGDSGFIQAWLWGRCGAAGWWRSSLLGLWSDRHWSHPQQQWVWGLTLFSSLQPEEVGQLDFFVLSWSCFTSHPGGFAESDWLLGISDSHLQRCFTECCYFASWKGWPLPIIMCCLVWMWILMVKDLRTTLQVTRVDSIFHTTSLCDRGSPKKRNSPSYSSSFQSLLWRSATPPAACFFVTSRTPP